MTNVLIWCIIEKKCLEGFIGWSADNYVEVCFMEKILDYKAILDHIPFAVYVGTPVRNESNLCVDFSIDYVNPALKTLMGDAVQSGMLFSSIKHLLTKEVPWLDIACSVLESGEGISRTFYSSRFNRWILLNVARYTDQSLVVVVQDVSDAKTSEQNLKQQDLRNANLTEELSITRTNMRNKLESIQTLNQQLQFAAYHDSLTNLYNRSYFNKYMNEATGDVSSDSQKIGLILVDVDNMKNINDAGGHKKGDAVIRKIATVLRKFENDRTAAFRFEGDEFIVVRKNISSRDEMSLLGYEMIQAVNSHGIGISGGISIFPEDSNNANDLLRYADMAKSEVKKNGKNNIYFFQKIMLDKFLHKMLLESKLTKALDEHVFQLYFQPQFDILTGELRGFEALIRWHDDELGWISPDKFIPLAEESRLVIPLGDWVMSTALETLSYWEKEFCFDGILSVNVSPIQFKKPDFIDDLTDMIRRYGIDVAHLEIEITEGIFIDNVQDTVSKLNTIRDMGIGISLDDFGTGYSSLRYLQILPLTTLKIDKSFISNIGVSGGVEANITESIVSLVSKMGLDTIAEGVENDAQLTVLKKINCHNVQGFLKGKPMPKERCDRMLAGDMSAILTVNNPTPESL